MENVIPNAIKKGKYYTTVHPFRRCRWMEYNVEMSI